MPFRRCFAGCPHGGAIIYPFPPKTDVPRRDLWIRQFGKIPEKCTQKHLYACRRHFSSYMTFGRLLRKNAYPDVNLSTYDRAKPYTERYSYYKSDVKPDPLLHDNFCEEWLVPPKDCGIELEFTPIEYIVPLSNELSHSEDSDSDNDEVKQQEDISTAQTAVNQQPSKASQAAKQAEITEDTIYRSKRQCILECKGRRSFHILPSIENELERRHKWLYLLGKDPALYTTKRLYVCDLHFDIHMVGLSKLIRGAYPNKNLPPRLMKSIPVGLEAQTECIQKCSDYKRKFKFPTLNLKMREAWLLKFGYNPTFYKHDIYACDRHFSDGMRVGPFLQAHAVPDQNLKLRTLCEDNTSNYVSKNWSLQRLDALANEVTVPTTSITQTPIATTTTDTPTINIIFSPTGTITKIIAPTTATTTMISPTATIPAMISPIVATTTHSAPLITAQIPTIEESAQNAYILKQPNPTVIPIASKNPTTQVEYVKMHTLGVFMQEKDGYVISLKQILNARDPLDCRRYVPMDVHEPIEPKINIKVHPIPKEIYEGNYLLSEDDATSSASEVSDDDAAVYNIKPNETDYTTAKMSTFKHTNDKQQINGKVKNPKGYYDYRSRVYEGPINNLKRKNYDLEYAMAKRVLLKVQRKEDELKEYGHRENNSENTINSNDLNEYAVTEDLILDNLNETYPTESFSLQRGQNNTVIKYKNNTTVESQAEDIITPDEPPSASKMQTQLKATTIQKNVALPQTKQQQQPNTNSLTKAVALAESWQQVVQTLQKEPLINVNACSTQQQPDAITLAARKLVEQIKQAGEREKLSLQHKSIVGNAVATGSTTTKNVDQTNPKAMQITNVQIFNVKQPLASGNLAQMKSTHAMHDDPKRAKITKVEIFNIKEPTNAANGNIIKMTEMKAQHWVEKHKEMLSIMDRANRTVKITTTTTTKTTKSNNTTTTATKSNNTTTATKSNNTTTQTPFKTHAANTHAHHTVDELLAKAKLILNANNSETPTNSHKLQFSNALEVDDDDDDDDELLKYPEADLSFVPITTTRITDADDNVATPYCILKCANFRQLYEFPAPDKQTFQRHFWFLQLGMDIASDWRKTLYICEKHFVDTMLLASDNTLSEYAYPCKSLVRQLNKSTATLGTQTDDNAVQYKQRLLEQLAALQQTLREQRLEMKRVKMLIRLKQAAARLVVEIEEEKNGPKLLTIHNK